MRFDYVIWSHWVVVGPILIQVHGFHSHGYYFGLKRHFQGFIGLGTPPRRDRMVELIYKGVLFGRTLVMRPRLQHCSNLWSIEHLLLICSLCSQPAKQLIRTYNYTPLYRHIIVPNATLCPHAPASSPPFTIKTARPPISAVLPRSSTNLRPSRLGIRTLSCCLASFLHCSPVLLV